MRLFGEIFRKSGVKLLALADVHRHDAVGELRFLEEQADLQAVRRSPVIHVDGHRASSASLQMLRAWRIVRFRRNTRSHRSCRKLAPCCRRFRSFAGPRRLCTSAMLKENDHDEVPQRTPPPPRSPDLAPSSRAASGTERSPSRRTQRPRRTAADPPAPRPPWFR